MAMFSTSTMDYTHQTSILLEARDILEDLSDVLARLEDREINFILARLNSEIGEVLQQAQEEVSIWKR